MPLPACPGQRLGSAWAVPRVTGPGGRGFQATRHSLPAAQSQGGRKLPAFLRLPKSPACIVTVDTAAQPAWEARRTLRARWAVTVFSCGIASYCPVVTPHYVTVHSMTTPRCDFRAQARTCTTSLRINSSHSAQDFTLCRGNNPLQSRAFMPRPTQTPALPAQQKSKAGHVCHDRFSDKVNILKKCPYDHYCEVSRSPQTGKHEFVEEALSREPLGA